MGAAAGFLKEDYSEKWEGYKTARLLNVYYGSLPLTLRTLFRVISGGADWYDASYPLWNVSLIYGLLFTAYIYLLVFGVLNVLVGVFVDSAMATASMDAEILAHAAAEEKKALLEQATLVLGSVDKDGGGTVTWEEFEMELTNPDVLS